MSDLTTLEDNLLPVPLGKEELHRLAMNIIGKDLEKDNYEFLSINSSLEKNPQFVCTKNKQLYFIIVKADSCILKTPKHLRLKILIKF